MRRLGHRPPLPGQPPTRVEFDPPSLRPPRQSNAFACGQPTRVEFDPPSLRQHRAQTDGFPAVRQRGSNSTLLHCGCKTPGQGTILICATRVEFDPPSLRLAPLTPPYAAPGATRVEFDPPSLRLDGLVLGYLQRPPTRVEFDPPSLRRRVRAAAAEGERVNEGRIRPSFIAAARVGSVSCPDVLQRGSNSTLLHCGLAAVSGPNGRRIQRGSNSTLLHCGTKQTVLFRRTAGNEGRIRPSFIAADQLRVATAGLLINEGRIRPSFIAAVAHRWASILRARSTRVEFDPPSLRPLPML